MSREVRDDGRLEPVEIEIDLSNAGYEPNFEFKEGGPEDPPLRVKVEPAATAHGGKVEFDESRQVVRYIHEGPQPGLIDEFEYTLVSSHDECPGEDVGKFSILMEPKLKPVEPPEPIETTNTVYGIVTIRTETFTEVGGLVYVREDPANPIPIGSGPAGEMGFYESRQLPVGTYHLVTRYEDYISAEVEIEIKAEPKTAQNLNLEQKTGRVRIRVVNRFDQPISASRITMARHDDERVRLVSNTPDPQGVHDFSVVLPGAYLVEASAPGSYEPRTLRNIRVSPGQETALTIPLPPIIDLPRTFSYANWFAASLNIKATRIEVETKYNERLENSREEVIKRGEENADVAASDSYDRAKDFMAEIVTVAALPLEALAIVYAKVADGIRGSIVHRNSNAAKKGSSPI